jgi:16S rRNA (guanine527-N7)-methyltransferase
LAENLIYYKKLIPKKKMPKIDLDLFKKYENLLLKWQKAVNLVSPNTLNNLTQRHFLDSAQLAKHIPHNAKIVDLGSGAGFPGMVLSIMGFDVSLVESDSKKCTFLKEIARHYNLSTPIYNVRIENFTEENPNIKFDIATARALTDITHLIEYALPLLKNNGQCFFLKGEKWEEEVKNAQTKYMFHVEHIQSETDSKAKILILSDIKNY